MWRLPNIRIDLICYDVEIYIDEPHEFCVLITLRQNGANYLIWGGGALVNALMNLRVP
jgi:hypothetical protein